MSQPLRLAHDWFDRPLPAGVLIGEGSWLYSAYAFIHCESRCPCPVRIGRHSGVYHGSFFELGPNGTVAIGDFCAIVGATINVDGRLSIGDYALIAHEVTIADSAWSVPAQAEGMKPLANDTTIGACVWIGTRATILSGVSIGEGAVVGAAAVVDRDVPPFAIAAGVPARVVGDSRRASRARLRDLR